MPITLDGSANYVGKDQVLNGVSSSKKGTFQCWLKREQSSTAETIFYGYNPDGLSLYVYSLRVEIDASDQILVLGSGGSAADLTYTSSTTIDDTDWHHIVFSFDNANSLFYLYIDRTQDSGTLSAQNDRALAFANTNKWTVGATRATTDSQFFDGSLDDVMFWPGVYVDLTDEDVLRRFVSSDGLTNYANPGPTAGTPKPVGYGPAGRDASGGTEAIIVFNGPFLVNRGTGGAFTVSGTLSSSRPVTSARDNTAWLTPGERWFNSDRSGWSYPRSQMLRDKEGRKIGYDEEDDPDRDDYREAEMGPLVLGLETDQEDVI